MGILDFCRVFRCRCIFYDAFEILYVTRSVVLYYIIIFTIIKCKCSFNVREANTFFVKRSQCELLIVGYNASPYCTDIL